MESRVRYGNRASKPKIFYDVVLCVLRFNGLAPVVVQSSGIRQASLSRPWEYYSFFIIFLEVCAAISAAYVVLTLPAAPAAHYLFILDFVVTSFLSPMLHFICFYKRRTILEVANRLALFEKNISYKILLGYLYVILTICWYAMCISKADGIGSIIGFCRTYVSITAYFMCCYFSAIFVYLVSALADHVDQFNQLWKCCDLKMHNTLRRSRVYWMKIWMVSKEIDRGTNIPILFTLFTLFFLALFSFFLTGTWRSESQWCWTTLHLIQGLPCVGLSAVICCICEKTYRMVSYI